MTDPLTNRLRGWLGTLLGRRPPGLQVGALCVDALTGHVLLVTTRRTGSWTIPRGWPMSGRSMAGAALQEALEEAGARGEIAEAAMGRYRYKKKLGAGLTQPVIVQVHLMQVTALERKYRERGQRQRAWFTPEEAADRVAPPGLKDLIRRLPAAQEGTPLPCARRR
ncbi:NUDIX hydrolase [Paracoccus jeotgali]|uniref:NUDIX hydrolase n=1 Tax=Paracoccus jeotgali TaxID=2065379 RepID=UPI0028A7EEC3|nr:NUDIX hydrolase [Paracoccus jeotgali]